MEKRQANIVPTDIAYTYEIMRKNISELKSRYPFLEIGSIGFSVLGKAIPYIKIGRGTKEVAYNATLHANEWIASVLLMKFVEEFSRAYSNGNNIFGYSARDIFEQTSIYVLPMMNPDGVDLVNGAIGENSELYQNVKLIANDFPQIPFPSGWKANIAGVDLKNYQPICKVL